MGTQAHTVPRFFLRGFVAPESESTPDPWVWVGSIETGEIKRRSPKKLSLVRGLYDGPGGFVEPDASIEAHLAKIESEAAFAIRGFAAAKPAPGFTIPRAISRFLAWQAARTPGWMEVVQQYVNDWVPGTEENVVEPPPDGWDEITDRSRPLCLEDPETGVRREVTDPVEFEAFRESGWRWVLRPDDQLEMLHIQAWYFQVRHFPRLSWVWLEAPEGARFVTSDRAVAWLADGYAHTPPAALRDPTAHVYAPLTRKIALVGRHGTDRLCVTAREINALVAFASTGWVAGPSLEVVETALSDRNTLSG